MIRPYFYTTEIYFNEEKAWEITSVKLLTENEVKAIEDNATTILAADAYNPDPKIWSDMGSGRYSFKDGVGLGLEVKRKYSILTERWGFDTVFDSRKNPIVSIIRRKKVRLNKQFSFKDVFEYRDIDRAAEYLKQFNLPINFSLDN